MFWGRKKTTTNHNRGGLANAGSVWTADGLSVNGMTTIHWRPEDAEVLPLGATATPQPKLSLFLCKGNVKPKTLYGADNFAGFCIIHHRVR